MADGDETEFEVEVTSVANGQAGFGHLTTGKRATVGTLGIAALLGVGGNVYQSTHDTTHDATSLTEIQTGLTDVIESMDRRHSQSITQCMFLLAGETQPTLPTVAPIATPSAPEPSEDG